MKNSNYKCTIHGEGDLQETIVAPIVYEAEIYFRFLVEKIDMDPGDIVWYTVFNKNNPEERDTFSIAVDEEEEEED